MGVSSSKSLVTNGGRLEALNPYNDKVLPIPSTNPSCSTKRKGRSEWLTGREKTWEDYGITGLGLLEGQARPNGGKLIASILVCGMHREAKPLQVLLGPAD
jgi:hypothetical protein